MKLDDEKIINCVCISRFLLWIIQFFYKVLDMIKRKLKVLITYLKTEQWKKNPRTNADDVLTIKFHIRSISFNFYTESSLKVI